MRTAIPLLVSILYLVLASGYASAADCGGSTKCECGDTLVESQVMWYDLTNCAETGLIFGANDKTLDCNGHIIAGTGFASFYPGILVSYEEDVTIKNCIVRWFENGIVVDHGSKNTLFNNTVEDSVHHGFLIFSSSYNNISNNNARNNPWEGIFLQSNSNNNNLTNNNITKSTVGIELTSSSYNRISNNTVMDSVFGIYLLWGSSDNNLTGNIVKGNDEVGIIVDESYRNDLINNIANNNDRGIYLLESSSNNLINNYANGNHPEGISLFKSSKNRLSGNTANNNMDKGVFGGRGIYLEDSSDNNILGNIVKGNTWAGIRLISSPNNNLTGNNITRNEYFGILFTSSNNNNLTRNNVSYNKNPFLQSAGWGVKLISSSWNNIIDNNITGNFIDGASLYDSQNNIFRGNSIIGNKYGVHAEASQYNIFWRNDFIGNTENNAYEYETSNNNKWDFSETGNYWDDFADNGGFPDAYYIDGPGNGIDHYPEGSDGGLCNSDQECVSGFCEGSENHEKRCCAAEPPADSWYGGGDDPGCGPDPDSNYEDYYCNPGGNSQYEVTDTFSCDWQDDCTTWCVGDNVYGYLDYYVIPDTNICFSGGGGLVEDCSTRISTDTDGGNVPLIFGTVTDYFTCSNGECSGSDYSDVCQTTTNLLEYFPNAASYSTQSWLCASFEEEASDSYGDDPTHTETCNPGKGAGCSGGQFNQYMESSATDNCQGTCGTGQNSCVFVEYYPADSDDACPGLDTCIPKNYDADTHQNTCNACKGANYWNLGGDVQNCCGDDSSEYKKIRVCAAGVCTSDPNDNACCVSDSKCVYGSVCYEDGYKGDPDDDLKKELCDNGIWKIAPPELYSPDDGAAYGYINDYLTATWQDTGADKYKIKIVLPSGNEIEQTVTEPKYPISPNLWNILPDGTYTWSVASVVGTYTSDFSEPRAVLKKTVPVLLSPPDWAELGLGDQTFDWEDVKNAETYFARVTIPGNPKPIEFQIPGGNSGWTILAKNWNPLPVGEYTWQVKSKKGGYESKYSEPWHFTKTEKD